jgi:hypothetical protein
VKQFKSVGVTDVPEDPDCFSAESEEEMKDKGAEDQ